MLFPSTTYLSILKEINPEYSLAEAEALILWPPDAKSWLIENDPEAGKDWRQEKKEMRGLDGWMASLSQWTWVRASSRRWWRTGKPGMLQSTGLQRARHDWVAEQQHGSNTGNYKGFRSYVPGTVDKDQMYVYCYKSQYHNSCPCLFIAKWS